MSDTLNTAISGFLENKCSPSRKVNELDNRGSHFYLALYWARALAEQNEDPELKSKFLEPAEQLFAKKEVILQELINAQGNPVDLGGYYYPDPEKVSAVMRPSSTLNSIINSI